MLARLFAYAQFLLPKFLLTSIVYHIARIPHAGFKDFLISRFVQLYGVDTSDIKLSVPDQFLTFNEFFIREFADDARPIDPDPNILTSPVDGTVSEIGQLCGNAILQAKGIEYSLDDLLATDIDDARAYADGSFATIYLAPYNYHRVHAPIAGTLVSASYVPGDLFSVNAATAETIRGLFRRNERLVLRFSTLHGPAAVIFVGALNVGSISTPWSGVIRPRYSGVVEAIELGAEAVTVAKGDLLGWFNMGSTVILLMPPGVCNWHESLSAGVAVRMGEAVGKLTDA